MPPDPAVTRTHPDPEPGQPDRVGWRSARRLSLLAYLLIYGLPWLAQPPTNQAVAASIVGIALFLVVFLDAYFRRPRLILPHVVAMAAIGYALAPFGGGWSVFSIYAASLAARMQPRRHGLLVVALLIVSLPPFSFAFGLPWFGWVSGVVFSALAVTGVLVQSDLEHRNRQLLEAQAEVRHLAASAERERIARDLHDLLGHTLTLVAMKADLAARLSLSAPQAARREMEEVATAARDALGEVRLAVTGMRGASLVVELERARAALVGAGLQATAEAAADTLDPDAEAVLSMALREAVTNVIRHARARSCAIRLATEADGALCLRVADDGAGGPILEGSGLAGMRTRLAAAGGTMRIESDAGGTRLVARLPELRPRAARWHAA